MEQRRRKVPVFLRQAIRQGIGVCIAVTLGYAIMGLLGGALYNDLAFSQAAFWFLGSSLLRTDPLSYRAD